MLAWGSLLMLLVCFHLVLLFEVSTYLNLF